MSEENYWVTPFALECLCSVYPQLARHGVDGFESRLCFMFDADFQSECIGDDIFRSRITGFMCKPAIIVFRKARRVVLSAYYDSSKDETEWLSPSEHAGDEELVSRQQVINSLRAVHTREFGDY